MPKFHSLKINEVRRETSDCVSVVFTVPDELRAEYLFAPGQYLTLKTNIGQEEVRRTYSICAGPADGELRVAIKQVEGGRFSTFANEQLQPGDELDVMTPLGKFTVSLDPAHRKHYVAFAAGSGITPILSILKAVLAVEPQSEFTLFYGNRRSDSIIFHEAIEGLKNEYMGRLSVHHILSREHTGSDLFSGRITVEKCETFFDKLLDLETIDEFFLCGPYDMTLSIRQWLEEQGVSRKHIHVELFTTSFGPATAPQKKKEHTSVEGEVYITLDGTSFTVPVTSSADTILDAALKGGADLPFACKGGVCATCRARLTEGEVEMDVNYALEPDEVAAGYILTCQSHPKTKKVVVDFDS